MSAREEYIAALREFADFLEANEDVREPHGQRFLLSLSTNAAVEEFAAAHGLEVSYDADGNSEAPMLFGPITFLAYGYADFDAHCELTAERNARTWAERKGMTIVPAPEAGDEA
ncbi:hypothetical protein ABZX65_27185 [Streptomyces sp. NPDC003300]|uniref:hypothetical protein n=1 Tax=unclassified Streptomyces TaxID=2593676 RepID=UPI0033B7D16E